jgi:aromatic-L-amino-acid decarboxylase
VLAEMLMATMGAQCMVWATSPAATELEDRVMEWLRQMVGLSSQWVGSIQNGASDATLNAILTAREQATAYQINQAGFKQQKFRIYASEQIHSSIDKAVAISGIGRDNLVKIATDEQFALQPALLEAAIQRDLQAGLQPLMIIAGIGTTGTTAIDPLAEITRIGQHFGLWIHVDAALAGTAMVLEERRWIADGLEEADSFVFNPHKWMFTNFDASAYFVKDQEALVNTFSITPEYLKTREDDQVNNYRDWGIPLGRRFRALKIWFVLRSYGVKGIQEKISKHLKLAQWFKTQVEASDKFVLMAPVPLNTVCFRRVFKNRTLEEENKYNDDLLYRINKTGDIFITHVVLNGHYTMRMVIGQTEVDQQHVEKAWQLIDELSE